MAHFEYLNSVAIYDWKKYNNVSSYNCLYIKTTQSQIIFDAKQIKAQTYKPAKTCDHKHHQEKHISPWSLYILTQFPLPTSHMGLNMLKKDNLLCFHLVRHVHFSDDFWSSDQYVNEIHPNLVLTV